MKRNYNITMEKKLREKRINQVCIKCILVGIYIYILFIHIKNKQLYIYIQVRALLSEPRAGAYCII